MRLLRMPGKMEVLIPSVMALRETAMTAPLGQQGEPLRFAGSSRNVGGDCDRRESLEGVMPVWARNDNFYYGTLK